MSNKSKYFTLTQLAKQYEDFKGLDLYTFYQELDKPNITEANNDVCDKRILLSGIEDPDVLTFLKNISRILKHLLSHQESSINNIKSKDKHCMYLKYWLYDKLIDKGFNQNDIDIIFSCLEKHKNGCMKLVSSDKPCNFYKLSLKDIYNIKNIYDYSELVFKADMNIYDKISKDSTHLDYFKKGLDLYKSSKTRCPTDRQNAYCYEFNEYERIHNKYKKELPFLSCPEKVLYSLNKKDNQLIKESSHNENTSDVPMDSELHKLLVDDNLLDEVKLHSFYKSLSKHNGNFTSNSCVPSSMYKIKEENAICNLFERVKSILIEWDETYAKYPNVSLDKSCDYLNYWLYEKLIHLGATPCGIEIFYYLWHKHVVDKKEIKNKCYREKSYVFTLEELANKKKLFDFLEYYIKIRGKLKEGNNKNEKRYCAYIKSIFELYKYMLHNNVSKEYNEELWLFRNIFFGNNELHFLEKKCPNMCLDLVFDVRYKTLCPLDKKPSVMDEQVDINICETEELSTVNRYLSKNNEKEYIFEDLNTFSVYNELNREVTTDNYYSFCSKLLPFSAKNCGIYGLCVKLARNIKDLWYMKNKERTDRCDYIIHWMYDKIRNILKIDTNGIYDTNALREFFKVGYEIIHTFGASDCLYNTTNVNFEEQKEKKHLHDYFKDYDKISCGDTYNSMKCEKYCEYVKHINGLYGKYISNCCNCFNSGRCMDMCSDYFKCEDTYNPHNLFETLKCKNMEKYSGGMEKIQKPFFADHYVTWLTEHFEKEKEKPLLKLEEKEFSITPKMESSSTPEKACDKITCDPFYVTTLGAFGFMGFLLISFISYKFTPLGSYFHNNDAKKNNIYFQQSEEQFLEDDFEFNHSNMENGRMRLAYYQA
ncbi:PIR Superfamily Protein [Plasmodium ovale wallikeri]|uniref:PIR Superfamily Protein n=1 Tax=Plasmodium ovale wallikeri TaxID=864142 RepID=A0A1A9AKI9_PLAOA|nr:PIR Superfamily Protein [Plasmodium ovale wallikeri]SBT57134.1 PIR Superfamily Protein [Plasmodium ovale wallikeri]